MSIITVTDFDTFGDWKTKTNAIATGVGDLALLQTAANTSTVAAINELKNGNIGNINVTGTSYNIDLNGIRKVHITDTGEIDLSNNVNVTGNFTAGGFGSFGGRMDIGGILDVDGATQINNTFKVTGAVDLDNTVNIDGAATLNSTLSVAGTITGTVTKCARSITPAAGLSYLLGGGDLTADRTMSVDGTTTATGNKLVARDAGGHIYVVNANISGDVNLSKAGARISWPNDQFGGGSDTCYIDTYNTGGENQRLRLYVDNDAGDAIELNASGGVYVPRGVINGTATSARFADLAEKYTTDKEYPPGTVMVVSHSTDSECTASFQPCQLALGVISTNPAYMMNSEAEGQYIALKGRVPVRVIGAIMKGQPLVATANGTAIYGQLNPIGVALETNMEIGEKLVEVAII